MVEAASLVDQGAATTIWQELDNWAEEFEPWQRFVLANAVRFGSLTEAQIAQAYTLFLSDNDLGDPPDPPIEIPEVITGRPVSEQPALIRLTRIGELRAINALPTSAELTFGAGLNVIYGANGTGKSGFARLLSSICFSRMQYPILPNVYEADRDISPAASIFLTDTAQREVSISLEDAIENPELKRIAVFDTAVAHKHLAERNPLGFTPTGFDVFPEMARVYGEIAKRLDAEIERRTPDNRFVRSFVPPESLISRLIAGLSAETDLEELGALASFGPPETSRLQEVQRQIDELKSKSVTETIRELEDTKKDLDGLMDRLADIASALSARKQDEYRVQVTSFVERTRIVAERGAESFRRDLFRGVGSREWELFLAAARGLAALEGAGYPQHSDHCLLCHRPLDEASVTLIRRFWSFLDSEARSQADDAKGELGRSAEVLKALKFDFFRADTTTRMRIARLNSDAASEIDAYLAVMGNSRDAMLRILEGGTGDFPNVPSGTATEILVAIRQQIDLDLHRLKRQDVSETLGDLETERVTLRHRQVLNQLFSEMRAYVADAVWAKSASGARRRLSPRHLTEKETGLFSTVIAESYRKRFAEECGTLDCNVPVEFRTQGQRGRTVRSLAIQGGHSPDEILSEGEKRAVALADFLTEVALNPANAGIVLDDPVTSMDHQRKERIARRLVSEAKDRQVVIFTHDLVFLTMLGAASDENHVEMHTHWIQRDSDGRPGQVSLNDCPAATPEYRSTQKAQMTLKEANSASGSARARLLQRGMAELRRTVEEIVPHFLLKQVVTRWNDRIIVTALKKVNWDHHLITDVIGTYEKLSAHIEGHTHTEEQMGAPIEPKHLVQMIGEIDDLIKRAKPDRKN